MAKTEHFEYNPYCYKPTISHIPDYIDKRVMDIIAHVVGFDYEEEKEYLTSEATWKDIGADSLDVVEVAMETEKEFGIILPDDKIEMCYTIGDFIELVRKIENE